MFALNVITAENVAAAQRIKDRQASIPEVYPAMNLAQSDTASDVEHRILWILKAHAGSSEYIAKTITDDLHKHYGI